MRISDRTIGYISLLLLLVILVLVTLGMIAAHRHEKASCIVDFPELGSLQPEDVVVVRGYRVGTIGEITWLGDRSRVLIKFDTPVIIREGTEFRNVNYALMGQRRLEMFPSKTGDILPQDFVHQGVFEPGIAEALRLMEDVNAQIHTVMETIFLIVEGDSTHPSATEIYESAFSGVENLLENTEKKINGIAPQIDKIFKTANDATHSLMDVADKADTTIKTVTQTITAKMDDANALIKKLAEGTAKINETITAFENTETFDKILNSKEQLEEINKLIEKFNQLIAAINTKGLQVLDENGKPVKLITWKNTRIFGKNARDKARERAEKAAQNK